MNQTSNKIDVYIIFILLYIVSISYIKYNFKYKNLCKILKSVISMLILSKTMIY